MQWIVEAYALLLASLVLVGGALGDRLGRRRLLVAGTLLFTMASAACAAAPTATVLVLTRGVQGVGAALLVPGSLALISAAYPERERGAAIGTWSAASAISTALGPIFGGWIVAEASWRWIFLVNVPLGALAVVLAQRKVAETRDPTAPPSLDTAGALLAVVGLGTVVFALLAHHFGFLVPGVLALGAFVVVETKQKAPMIPHGLFRNRAFTGTNLLTLLLYAALGGALFFLPFNLIQLQGYQPTAAGAAFLPLTILLSVMSPITGKLADRFGARVLLTLGPLVAAAGFALLARPSIGGSYVTTVLPGVAVLGIGMGITVAPLTATVMGSVDEHHAGAASGVNNAVARVAALLAIAVFGVLLQSRFDRVLDRELDAMALTPEERAVIDAERPRLAGADLGALARREEIRRRIEAAYLAGYRTVMLASALLALAGAGAAAATVRRAPELAV
jgi:EmrB/QacA subfamily drug resistance transporter